MTPPPTRCLLQAMKTGLRRPGRRIEEGVSIVSSIMTNASAMTALQSLSATNKALETTQNRISTGYRVSEAKDNAAYWSIATTMRSDNKALSVVQDALGLGASKVDTAYTAMNKVMERVDEIKVKLVAAVGSSADNKDKIQSEIAALQIQLKSFADSASFSGTNWLSVASTVAAGNPSAGTHADAEIVSSFTRDASGNVVLVQDQDQRPGDQALRLRGHHRRDARHPEGLRLATTGVREDTATAGVAGTVAALDGYSVSTLTVVGFTDAQITQMITVADQTLAEIADAATMLGAAKKQIDLQKEFTTSLMDSIERGVGQLVDADMNKESTRLQALQVQQQLGIQSLQIANSNAQRVLSLFQRSKPPDIRHTGKLEKGLIRFPQGSGSGSSLLFGQIFRRTLCIFLSESSRFHPRTSFGPYSRLVEHRIRKRASGSGQSDAQRNAGAKSVPEQLNAIVRNLRDFGPRRLALMGGIVALVLSVIGVASVYLNRPAYETLYVGLERSDVNQIGLVLGEAGIGFDVASDGTTVLVPAGKTAQARMLLAEKGLPTSANAGYELFDNVGSLGLTSFMQQITRVRALEGEIARTIQSISGIRAARVHIVMSERANFRRDEQKPSASVVIRSSGDGRRARSLFDPLPGRRRRARPRRRGGHGARFQRHAAGRRRRSEQHQRQPFARRRAHGRDADRGQHPPRARPLSRAGQFPRQRQGRGQHRHPSDRRDHLRSGVARRALRADRPRQREQQPAVDRRAGERRAEPARGRRRRRPTARNPPSRASARRKPPTTR